MAKNLVGAKSVFRYNPEVAPGRYSLDDAGALRSLVGLGHQTARHALEEIRHMFAEPAPPFSPAGSSEQ
jgi:hypothetical protein